MPRGVFVGSDISLGAKHSEGWSLLAKDNQRTAVH